MIVDYKCDNIEISRGLELEISPVKKKLKIKNPPC